MRWLDTTLRHLSHALHMDHQHLGRYSIEKLHLFDVYQRTSTTPRVCLVTFLTPLPTLLALIVMDVVPLNDPVLGPSLNAMAFVRSMHSHALMTFVTLLPMKQALRLNNDEYSYLTVARIAVATSLTVEAACLTLAFVYRFPLPFRELIGLPIWTMSVVVYNYVFAKETLCRHWRGLKRYLPIVSVQVMLLYLFLALSVGFGYLSFVPQTVAILVFPLVKLYLKNLVWHYARALDDISTDVTICLVEIGGALFQTMCMQLVTSIWLNALVVVTDIVQAVVEIRAYMKMDYLSDGKQTVTTVRKIIESSIRMAGGSGLSAPFRSTRTRTRRSLDGSSETTEQSMAKSGRVSPKSTKVLLRRQSSARLARSSDKSTATTTTRVRDSTVVSPRLVAEQARRLAESRAMSVYIPSQNLRRKSSRRLLDLNQSRVDISDRHLSERSESGHSDAQPVVDSGLSVPQSAAMQQETTPSPNAVITPVPEFVGSLRRKSSTRTPRAGVASRLRRIVRRASRSHLRSQHKNSVSATATFSNLQAMDPQTGAMVHPIASTGLGASSRRLQQYQPDKAPLEKPALSLVAQPGTLPRRSSVVMVVGIVVPRRDQARILEQTLQLLFACEVLLFVEYMEVVILFLYALCLRCDWILPNGQYNLFVRGMSDADVHLMLLNSLVYALLELASLLAMYYVMKTKYGVSAFCQLAFVLGRYWLTLQGKLVGAFIVIWNAATVHQGTAFV
ncbi:hypothetical protein Poli38472_007949 [Pythium oligandrum]|uniref:Transmembrane protein n=1 Tax=Pythium oligandrum TaxID=41045 RepID=A0A8K1CMX9_PYTOL|nr:hypothetical protein Poli38472_007949 [Pythium oligandrum]|eukprot:TMW65307.1 hypothetical protein Poli38472_007949 [Pythium oligandrum]